MQITMDQAEIEEAVANHVRSLITIPDTHEIGMDFTAGRGENGLSVALKINAPEDAPKAERKATPVTKPKAATKLAAVKEDAVEEKKADEAAKDPEVEAAPANEASDEPETSEAEANPDPETEAAPKPRSIFSKQTA